MAEDLLSHYQHVIKELTFITGSKGAFDVIVNGDLIFSKKQLGRHAEPGEVLARFKELVGPNTPIYPQ